MNKKLKIYLDTPVVSYLLQEDVPEKMDYYNEGAKEVQRIMQEMKKENNQ